MWRGSHVQSNPKRESVGRGFGSITFAFVLSRFILSSEHISKSLKIVIKLWIESLSLTKQVVSSASCVILISVLCMHIPLTLLSVRILLARVSTAIINKYGDRGQPCRTPLPMENHLDICPLFSTAAHISFYSVFTYDLNFKPKLKFFKHLSRYDHFKESKAFSKSMASMIPFTLFCLV